MAKKKTLVQQAAGTEITLVIPNTERIGVLKDLNPKFSLTTKYKSADEWAAHKDKPIRAFYMGLKEVPNENGEMVKCGVFISETEIFLSGQMVLIEAVKQLDTDTPVQITYRGKKANKSSDGQTMLFDVEKLG